MLSDFSAFSASEIRVLPARLHGNCCIGLETFKHIMHDERVQYMPLILETPKVTRDFDYGEIHELYKLSDDLL